MNLWKRVGGISVLLLLTAIGLAFGSMPRNWIELRFGINLDGGNGLLEFFLATVPVSACVALAIRQALRRRSVSDAPIRPLLQTDSLNEN